MASPDNTTPNPEIQTLWKQLDSDDPHIVYDAICALARYPTHEQWRETWERVFKFAEDYSDKVDPRVHSAAGIAGSMISARNTSSLDKRSILYGMPIPDFLVSWERASRGMRCPTRDEWNMIGDPLHLADDTND